MYIKYDQVKSSGADPQLLCATVAHYHLLRNKVVLQDKRACSGAYKIIPLKDRYVDYPLFTMTAS